MRARILAPLLSAAAIAACAHDDPCQHAGPKQPEQRQTGAASGGPQQYLVADPGQRENVIAVSLGGVGGVGIAVDRARIVSGRGEPKVGVDTPDSPIVGVARIPGRFGGGFLFWTESALYRADAFDAALKPIARVPDAVQNLSFSPKYLLVRTRNGERWAISLPSGDRAKIDPLGVADIEALDDGRAIAFTDQGAAFASTDGGAHWRDVTTHIKSSPTRAASIDGEAWLFESNGGAHRLEPDGNLSWFDQQPAEDPPELRREDPRWRGHEAPLREAFRGGAALDDSTALVVAGGDLVRVDVHTGEIAGVHAGKAPPEAICDAVPISGDVLFACVLWNSKGSGLAGAFVLSHTLGDQPVVEQTFPSAGRFFASDDGGLAFEGGCGGGGNSGAACVREPNGQWIEVDVSALTGDAGAGDVVVSRWVPRADGRAVAIVSEPTPGLFDPRTGALIPWKNEVRDIIARLGSEGRSRHLHGARVTFHASLTVDVHFVDWGWTFSPTGTLRGWARRGGVVEITEDGQVTRSPYALELVSSGPYAVGRTADGRLFQSSDHGASWTEVATPPSGAASLELHSCSSAGCDLGGFYRVGWAPRPPRPEATPAPVRVPAELRREEPIELACRPAGAVQSKTLGRTDRSPEDLGLGNARLPTGDGDRVMYMRVPIQKAIANPLHDATDSSGDESPSLRALLSGLQTQRDSDIITVVGPNPHASQLRRPIAFVAPFDPASPVRRVSLAMSDVIAAGRAAGLTTEEILQDDMTESLGFLPVTPVDPGAPGELAGYAPRGLVVHVRGERARVAVRPGQSEGNLLSGAAISTDEVAFLEVEESGVGHVFKMSSGGLTDLFDVSPTISAPSLYPANPDAVAVGPKSGDLGILRTPSGSDPASANDPALLVVPAMPAVALAPWSTLRFADDPACKADPGWRATLQIIAPWVRITTPELKVEEGPMIARVKWNERRVCLEGLEVRLPTVSARASHAGGTTEAITVSSWLVSRGSTFARVGIGEGIEWRQPLECSFAKP